jgi:8-amino-7-oxononanoate synthase
MDGDIAPLPALAETAAAHAAWLLVDDAHGLGVTGPQGRGSLAAHSLGLQQVPILMGTLGKAFGTFGAFVAGSDDLIETLIQEARTWIYTTAPPPAVAVATLAALRLVESQDWRREHLQALVQRFRAGAAQLGLQLYDSATPIQPVLAGTPQAALYWSRALREAGILITAIRPPTVPQGTSRLRITFSAGHSEAQVDRLLDALEQTRADANQAEHG